MATKSFEKNAPISMQDFLDFLKLACHVHESIAVVHDKDDKEKEIDYTALAKNDLVNGLINSTKSGQSPKLDVIDDDKNGKFYYF